MKQRVLIVEDNPANLELLSAWLGSEGYAVAAASNLAGAFGLLEREQFLAVLLDVQLAGEDGLEVAAWIRRQPALRDLPVIAVTAQAMANEGERIRQAGCHGYVSKPVDFDLLRKELRRWRVSPPQPGGSSPEGGLAHANEGSGGG